MTLSSKTEEKNELIDNLRKMMLIDKTSSLPNQEYLKIEFEKHIEELEENDTPFGFIKIDIDNLGKIEHTFGPNIVNSILKVISHTLMSIMKKKDTLGRFSYTSILIISPYRDDKKFKRWIDLISLLLKNYEFNIPIRDQESSELKYSITHKIFEDKEDIIKFNQIRTFE